MSPNVEPTKSDLPIDKFPETASTSDETGNTSKKSRLISKVLSPAVRFWLRSQLEQAEELEFSIEAGDRQLLSGSIQQVSVSASKAIYQGIHLSAVQLVAEQIRTNLGQVMRGKPLRLLQAFPVSGEIRLNEADLNASLSASLLRDAIVDFLLNHLNLSAQLHSSSGQQVQLQNPQVVIEAENLIFTATLVSGQSEPLPIALSTQLRIENGNRLILDLPHWLNPTPATTNIPLQNMTFELGSHVALEELTLQPGQLFCRGQVMVTPAE